ncbi:MAG: voltage-gated chloride channel protein [Clostridiaceae bacterium]|nr:voltage-gated chloride channel protein [Clostridiaceae bacterium]
MGFVSSERVFKLKRALSTYKNLALLGLVSALIGTITGGLDAIFQKGLIFATSVRESYPYIFIPLLPLAGILILYLYQKFAKESMKGAKLIFQAPEEEKAIPKRTIPFAIFSTWLTHLCGGSAGREGIAVLIGASVGDNFAKRICRPNSQALLTAGIAAGFSGLFHTPVAAVFFAIEIFSHGAISKASLFCSIISSFFAYGASSFLGVKEFMPAVIVPVSINTGLILKIIVLGVIFGITGGFFAYLLHFSKTHLKDRIKNPVVRVFSLGVVLSALVLFIHNGRYAGSGANLINSAFYSGKIHPYDWLLKLILTILTASCGFQGGEVVPLFSIGASLGDVLSPVFGVPSNFLAALGFVSVFGSATNTLITPIFIGCEIFGYEYFPYFFFICAVSYVANGGFSIYHEHNNKDLNISSLKFAK